MAVLQLGQLPECQVQAAQARSEGVDRIEEYVRRLAVQAKTMTSLSLPRAL